MPFVTLSREWLKLAMRESLNLRFRLRITVEPCPLLTKGFSAMCLATRFSSGIDVGKNHSS